MNGQKSFGRHDIADQSDFLLGALCKAAEDYHRCSAGSHFDEHGVEHYLQARLFDALAGWSGGSGKEKNYVALEISPRVVLTDLKVRNFEEMPEFKALGSQRFDLVFGATLGMGERSPRAIVEIKRDLADGWTADDVRKIIRFQKAAKLAGADKIPLGVCLGLRREKWPLSLDEFERKVRIAAKDEDECILVESGRREFSYEGEAGNAVAFFINLP